eukprot:3828504-Amphidinium_carterae.1
MQQLAETATTAGDKPDTARRLKADFAASEAFMYHPTCGIRNLDGNPIPQPFQNCSKPVVPRGRFRARYL